MINCVLDFDPGVDDAATLFTIKKAKDLGLLTFSSMSGNVSIDHTTRNVQRLAKLLDINVPMGKEQEVPLVGELFFAAVHGDDRTAGFGDMTKSDDIEELSNKNSITMMHEIIQKSTEEITIIVVEPLADIALLLQAFPGDKEKIEQISIMGGSITRRGVAGLSGSNFFVDPETVKIVFGSGAKLVMAGLNITQRASITGGQIQFLDTTEMKRTKFAHRILRYYTSNDAGVHDPCFVIVPDSPEVFETEDMYIKIDIQNDETRGMSYRDLIEEKSGGFNCKVITKVNREKFREILTQSLTE